MCISRERQNWKTIENTNFQHRNNWGSYRNNFTTKVGWNLNCIPWGVSFQNFGQLEFNYDNSLSRANVWVKFQEFQVYQK